MLRLAALLAAIALAACTTTPTTPASNAQPAVTLSMRDLQDAPNRVQDLFYAALSQEAFLQDGIAWDPGVTGEVVVRGFLSIVASDSGTLLIYVFDFEDRSGQRLLRVSDQVNSRSTPDDPWDIVDFSFAADIWDDVLDQFADWLAQNSVGV